MKFFRLLPAASFALAAVLFAAPPAAAETPMRPTLTLDAAQKILDAALAEARRDGGTGVVAIVDDGGQLMLLERLDGTFPAGAAVSTGKARTAALFMRPTRFFEELIGKGRTAMAALPDFTPLIGGVPIMLDGHVVGAIGVSGAASAARDEEVALAGVKAAEMMTAQAASPAVTLFPAAQVRDAFRQGMPLLETDGYKVHASHRDSAGMAEVHSRDTDIIYVLKGQATFMTGGTVVNGHPTVAEEIRGDAITGGTTRKLSAGDVVIVPSGVPHWFEQLSGPFDYYVVKVRDRQ